jgi:hypothetical protein
MTDTELRGIILKWFYEHRRKGIVIPKPDNFNPVIHHDDLYRVCDQLAEHSLLDWTPHFSSRFGSRKTDYGSGKISASGIDVVESEGKSSPLAINFQNISITQSQGVQIGHQNIQSISFTIEQLIFGIDNMTAPEQDKQEAKSRLRAFLEHPLVIAIIGNLAGKLSGL